MHETPARRPGAKETRISVRIKPSQKALIARAARLQQTTLTDFVVEHALHAASQLVAEEKHFELTPEQFQPLLFNALDAPPARNLKAMQRPLNEPTVLDE